VDESRISMLTDVDAIHLSTFRLLNAQVRGAGIQANDENKNKTKKKKGKSEKEGDTKK
jgi:hypothetical protein